MHHVQVVGECHDGVRERGGALEDGSTLTGERRLVDGESLGLHHARIRRHLVTRAERQHVARHQHVGGHDLFLAFAPHERARDRGVLERREDPLHAPLRQVADGRVRGDYREDHRSLERGSARDRQRRGSPEEQDGERRDVIGQDREGGLRPGHGQAIGADRGQACLRALAREPAGGRRRKPLEHRGHGEGVPRFTGGAAAVRARVAVASVGTHRLHEDADRHPARLEAHEHAARQRVHVDGMNAVVGQEALGKASGERGLLAQSSDAESDPTRDGARDDKDRCRHR